MKKFVIKSIIYRIHNKDKLKPNGNRYNIENMHMHGYFCDCFLILVYTTNSFGLKPLTIFAFHRNSYMNVQERMVILQLTHIRQIWESISTMLTTVT